eukprot:gnl/TRDRNA2_/TRDRNA2_137772_c0_seq4.p1 gnl/TRDRNA2_/TRDRNA2_137772_c0~~gnl/TRDRNA2_/TRDRNA2_137772_c0_seq4.p1  ORF type:complete len:137 (+),score=21.57 gnl/TRDRNA2_/TRDRNA2_137772_c0_seq4:239-649(+)
MHAQHETLCQERDQLVERLFDAEEHRRITAAELSLLQKMQQERATAQPQPQRPVAFSEGHDGARHPHHGPPLHASQNRLERAAAAVARPQAVSHVHPGYCVVGGTSVVRRPGSPRRLQQQQGHQPYEPVAAPLLRC